MFWGPFTRSVNSTGLGVTADPTTASILAEIDFNGTNATCPANGQNVLVNWVVGVQTTLAVFLLEHVRSTGLDVSTNTDSTRGGGQTPVMVSSGQSAQFVTKHAVEPGNRFRVRVLSSVTANVSARIFAEPMA